MTAALCVAAVSATPAAASTTPRPIDATVMMTCTAGPGPSFGDYASANFLIPQQLAVRLRGTIPSTASAEAPLSISGLQADFTWDPQLFRLQAHILIGRMGASLTDFAVRADGASPATTPIVAPGAPLNLTGTSWEDVWMDTPIRLSAPSSDSETFPPVGPLTVSAPAGGSVGLSLAPLQMYLTSPTTAPPGQIGLAVIIERTLTCTPSTAAPFATVPVVDGAVTPPAPVVASISPRMVSARRGGFVRVRGRNLKGATAVTVGSRPAPFFVLGTSELWAYAPPQAAGPYQLRITTPAGTSSDTARSTLTYR